MMNSEIAFIVAKQERMYTIIWLVGLASLKENLLNLLR